MRTVVEALGDSDGVPHHVPAQSAREQLPDLLRGAPHLDIHHDLGFRGRVVALRVRAIRIRAIRV